MPAVFLVCRQVGYRQPVSPFIPPLLTQLRGGAKLLGEELDCRAGSVVLGPGWMTICYVEKLRTHLGCHPHLNLHIFKMGILRPEGNFPHLKLIFDFF